MASPFPSYKPSHLPINDLLHCQNLNSILKSYASSLELGFAAVFAWALFGVPVTSQTLLSISIISAAVYLYDCTSSGEEPTPAANFSNHKFCVNARCERESMKS